jgi:hypothetical protein
VNAQHMTAGEITAAMFRSGLTSDHMHFAMAEVLTYLAYHRARGRIQRDLDTAATRVEGIRRRPRRHRT